MAKTKREFFTDVSGQTMLRISNGSEYKVDGSNVLHRDLDSIMYRLDYSIPPISTMGFTDVMDFKQFLIEEVSNELNLPLDEMQTMFKQKNSVDLLKPLEDDWKSNRDCARLYQNPHYLLETLHCNLFVSCEFNKTINNMGKNCTIDNILRTFHLLDLWDKPIHIGDWGAGMGLTTLWMAAAMPKSTVYYIEINPPSKRIFSKLVKRLGLTNVVFVEDVKDLPKLDVSVCIEYIEHIPHSSAFNTGDVMQATDEVLSYTKDDGFFMYSTKWNEGKKEEVSLGHFSFYDFDGDVVEILPRTKKPHMQLVKKMQKRGWNVLNGNPKKTKWDFRYHKPYVFSKKYNAQTIPLLK